MVFSKALNDITNVKKNYGAPDEFKKLVRIEAKDIVDKPITIKRCFVKTYHNYSKEEESYTFYKDGSPVLNFVVFLQISDDSFIALKSTPVKEQIESITNRDFSKIGFVEVDEIVETSVKISSIDVKYADNKTYSNWVLVDND